MASDHVDQTIPVDYGKSLQEVYADVIKFFNSSTIDSERKRIEMMYIASLLRRLLTGEGQPVSFTPKRQISFAITEVTKKQLAEELKNPEIREKPDYSGLPIWTRLLVIILTEPLLWALGIDCVVEGVKLVFSHGSLWPETLYTMSYLPSLPEEEDFWALKTSAETFNAKDIILRAPTVGKVERIGPLVPDLLSSFAAMKKWNAHVVQHFQGSTSLKQARAQNERLISILSHSPSAKYKHVRSYDSIEVSSQPRMDSLQRKGSPHVFIGSDVFLGLIPPGAQVGDLVCQFWNSTASAIVRRTGDNVYEVVGKATVVQHGESLDWDVPTEYGRFAGSSTELLDLRINLGVLTALSLDTIDMPYYS